MTKRWGATPDDWAHFDLVLGLGQDLLPVVSNPDAEISPNSKMKDMGKTPSRYNKQRKVGGIPDWTSHITSGQDIARWSKEPDYGICLQTREVRALDIDVADAHKATAIGLAFGPHMPVRFRGNSGKRLLAFRVKGELAKRVVKVDGGMVEFLANGQQFIAMGTHPSGARYEWSGGHLPEEFPEITVEQFEALWAALVKEFAIEAPSEGGLRKPKTEVAGAIADSTLTFLEENGYVKSYGKEGQAFITCPFEEEHTTDSGETATAYFPKGTRGYEQGHFVCLHAHCAGRDDGEFTQALGVLDGDFEVVASSDDARQPLPPLSRDNVGRILATVGNLEAVLMRPDMCGEYIRFDTFRDEIMWAPLNKPHSWRTFRDVDYTRLRVYLEGQGFKPIAKEMIRDVVHRVADLTQFDTAIEWLKGLKWDGKPRIARFFHDYFGAANDQYTESVSLYMWTALAGRVLEPGVKADMVPVLVGQQGVGKSYGVASMVPSYEHTESIDLMARDADLARRMRGKLVIEIGELRGLHSRDMESIKEFITRTHESWVPKYQEFAEKYPRRCVFIGTTNQIEFLADTTGNRRWLPVICGKVLVKMIEADREQLWAEAREMFELIGGVAWQDAQRLGEQAHETHRMTDSWAEAIEEWLYNPDECDGTSPIARGYVQVRDVLQHALNLDLRNVRRGDELRVSAILREKGLTRKNLRVDGRVLKVWAPREGQK